MVSIIGSNKGPKGPTFLFYARARAYTELLSSVGSANPWSKDLRGRQIRGIPGIRGSRPLGPLVARVLGPGGP